MEIGLGVLVHRKINLRSKATIGYIVMILSAAFTGLTNAFAKPLIDIEGFSTMEISPITLVALIYLINFFFFTPLAKNSTPLRTIGRRNMFFLTLIGISEVAGLMTYFFGLKESTAINSAIMSEGEMIFSLLIAITILRERLRRKELSPFAMIIVGMVIIPVGFDLYQNGFTMSELVFGDMLILVSGLFYALDINLCKYVSKRFDARRITQITSLVSGVFALGLMLMFNIPFNIDWSQIPSIALLSIIGTGLAAFFFIIALRLIGAVRSLLLYSSSSAFGVIFSSAFLGEAITIANV
ncbi:MAG TPA: DMT family transporter, partial [Nitrosopumilaceae archaeon]|nr:DMT family transporter [Nitrosopumilaceae archaeon]